MNYVDFFLVFACVILTLAACGVFMCVWWGVIRRKPRIWKIKISTLKWSSLLAIGVVFAVALLGVFIGAIWPKGSHHRGDPVSLYKCIIQDTVNNYIASNNGLLPPHEGSYNVSGVGYCYIIDICSLVGDPNEGFMRDIPDGCLGENGDADTNFYSGNCENFYDPAVSGHYVWVMDNKSNVYSVCDVDDDGVISEDGVENVDGLQDDIWP